MFNYREVDEGEEIEDRLMIPLDALELAVQGGWKMADFVGDLKGENGEQAKTVADAYLSAGGFLLTPSFWLCLGRALGWAGSLPVAFNGVERAYPRAIYEAMRWAECALTAKPSERLSKQESFWKELLSKRMSAQQWLRS